MNRPNLSIYLLTLIILSGCSGTSPASQDHASASLEPIGELFSLKVMAIPEEGGRILPVEGEYPANTKVILNAIPSKGFGFVSWSGDASGTGNSLQITMNSDKLAIGNFSQLLTPTPKPTPTATPEPCRKPAGITADDAGQLLEVCGEVTNWGVLPCPACALGGYSFLKMDGAFLIITYDWVFNENWVGNCMLVADTVEMLGAAPVFVFGTGEGYAGSECATEADGSRSCSSGDYFLQWFGCESN
ncbi:MAG: hypothetical protein MUP11_01110 [Anaerolineales bacterium]|nr:hypothetical protein [Anaerolineales bacterium]